MQTLFSLIESPIHPNFSGLYQQLGIAEQRFTAARKLHKALQQQAPDFLVGEFIYGFGNNYAGANVCNLDVTLRALQRFSPHTKVLVFVHPNEAQYVDKLLELFPIHAVLKYPVTEQAMREALQISL
jgi:AmiR/NasT family two-component response regulator